MASDEYAASLLRSSDRRVLEYSSSNVQTLVAKDFC